MGGRFSSGCAVTYVFVLRPNPVSGNAEITSERRQFAKSFEGESSKSFDLEEAQGLLHRSLTDVEAFISQIQRVVEHAKNSNKHRSKLNFGKREKISSTSSFKSSLLYLLPSELDMAEVFKRLKLAINYIAKLKYHLYEPNASELIHTVFFHLATLNDICQSYSVYDSTLPSKTVLPLLSRDSIRLLRLTLVSREIDLWKSLGKTWTLPRDEWKGRGSLWNPVLLEGWEACYPPSGSVTLSQPWSNRSRHWSGHTESETLFSDESQSLSTTRSRFS